MGGEKKKEIVLARTMRASSESTMKQSSRWRIGNDKKEKVLFRRAVMSSLETENRREIDIWVGGVDGGRIIHDESSHARGGNAIGDQQKYWSLQRRIEVDGEIVGDGFPYARKQQNEEDERRGKKIINRRTAHTKIR